MLPRHLPFPLQAIYEHGAAAGFVPLEPRHMTELAAVRLAARATPSDPVAKDVGTGLLDMEPLTGAPVEAPDAQRRGPLIGPTTLEALLAYGAPEDLEATLSYNREVRRGSIFLLVPLPPPLWGSCSSPTQHTSYLLTSTPSPNYRRGLPDKSKAKSCPN